jgi:crotonobetainyl-CoA:carnitine CoA-transferase CaiB-like acyl-CoA transferase
VKPLLEGMRVVDASAWRPMPYATQLLADLGADVLKIEPPGGDPMRGFPELFAEVASNKRSVVIDLRTADGRTRALELVADADVFCEGWRPGVATRLGLGDDDVRAVNPSIIYCSLSGYGQGGAFASLPGHDVNYQALAGALAKRGPHDQDPAIPRVPVADLAGGMMAALTICAAWAKRLQTDEGEHIDVAMTDVVASWVGPRSGTARRDREAPAQGSAGYGVFRCADGEFVTLGVIAEDHFWRAVCDALGIDALRDLTYVERLDRVVECNERVAESLTKIDSADAVARLTDAGAPVAPVLRPEEVGAHRHFRERGVIVEEPPGVPRVGFPAVLRMHPARPPGPVPQPGT